MPVVQLGQKAGSSELKSSFEIRLAYCCYGVPKVYSVSHCQSACMKPRRNPNNTL